MTNPHAGPHDREVLAASRPGMRHPGWSDGAWPAPIAALLAALLGVLAVAGVVLDWLDGGLL